MESECGYVGLVALELELGRIDRNVELLGGQVYRTFLCWPTWHLLQVLDHLLEVGDLLLEGENGFPLELKLISFWVDFCQTDPELL